MGLAQFKDRGPRMGTQDGDPGRHFLVISGWGFGVFFRAVGFCYSDAGGARFVVFSVFLFLFLSSF